MTISYRKRTDEWKTRTICYCSTKPCTWVQWRQWSKHKIASPCCKATYTVV